MIRVDPSMQLELMKKSSSLFDALSAELKLLTLIVMKCTISLT